MVLKQKATDAYQVMIYNLFGNLERFSPSDYTSRVVGNKAPGYISRFFKPEKRYLRSSLSELDPYVSELIGNAKKTLSDPERARTTTLDHLIRFEDPVKQKEFCDKLYTTVEDLSYASEIGAKKGYDLWKEYSQKPIIGYFMRRGLKKKIGMTELPDFSLVQGLISNEANEARKILKQYDPHFSPTKSATRDVQRRYHHRMGDISKDRRLLAYDHENPDFIPPERSRTSPNLLENICSNSPRINPSFSEGCLRSIFGYVPWIGIILGIGVALL